jgi:hypothetical protein
MLIRIGILQLLTSMRHFGSGAIENRRYFFIILLEEHLESMSMNYDLILLCIVTVSLSDYAVGVLQAIPRSIIGYCVV